MKLKELQATLKKLKKQRIKIDKNMQAFNAEASSLEKEILEYYKANYDDLTGAEIRIFASFESGNLLENPWEKLPILLKDENDKIELYEWDFDKGEITE